MCATSFDFDCEDGLSVTLSYGYDFTKIEEMERHIGVPQNVHESALALQALQTVPYGNVFIDLVLSHKKLLPSILQAPELELKPLPDNLKYVFIGDNNTLPVIIAKGLTSMQEEKLVKLLCDHKMAIRWTLANIKGISPSMCMHHILLEDNAKPTREMQRRLNPPMMEVVKAEILKLLDAGVIYPITDCKWVAPIHVVPKKTRITLVKNKNDERIRTRISSGWRMCVDYRKLNLATRKDHFPLPFMDQMLERLAGKSFYCFLDGYSGYNQIVINHEDQEKTTFTCPFGTYAYRSVAPDITAALKIKIGKEWISGILFFDGEWSLFKESPPSIMVTRNPNWSIEILWFGTGYVKGKILSPLKRPA